MSPHKKAATPPPPSSPPVSPTKGAQTPKKGNNAMPELKRKAKDGNVQQYLGQYGVVDNVEKWSKSTVHKDATLTQGLACERYALKPKEIAHLEYREHDPDKGDPEKEGSRIWHLYKEREVEEVARRKYTTPARLAKAIGNQQEPEQAGPSPKKQRISDTDRSTPPPSPSGSQQHTSQSEETDAPKESDTQGPSRTVITTSEILEGVASMAADLRKGGRGWLYEVLSEKARELVPDSAPNPKRLRGLAVLAAEEQLQVVQRYPARTDHSVSSSLTTRPRSRLVTNLYTILEESSPPNPTDNNNANQESPSKRTRKFKWSDEYSERVYTALYNIAKEHGPNGWEEARWIVYDQYRKTGFGDMSVTVVNGADNKPDWKWNDTAVFWLHFKEYTMGAFLKGPFSKLLNI